MPRQCSDIPLHTSARLVADHPLGIPGALAGRQPLRDRGPLFQERAELREKADAGVKEDVQHYKKCMERAQQLKHDKLREKEDKAKKKQLSFREKEKRKRDAGMQSSGRPSFLHLLPTVNFSLWNDVDLVCSQELC